MRFRVTTGLTAVMFVPALFFLVVFFVGHPVSAQFNQPQTGPITMSPGPASPKQVKTYLHPVRKFVLAIPLGADLSERGDSVQVSIRSRSGYIINIQTGDANPAMTLAQMVSKLEAQYLGLGKPWSQKIGGKNTTVAGLQAVEAMYEGANTRVKVIIVRGAKTDFVFIFFAPFEAFEKLAHEFDWFLSNFQPNPADLLLVAKPGIKPGGIAEKTPATGDIPPKRFSQSGFGYAIQYPGNWEVTKPSDTTATFSGKKGTPAFQVFVNIQNVRKAKATTPGDAADQVLADLKASLARDAKDFSIVGEKPLTYKNGNLSLAGRQMVVVYTHAGQRYRKWALVLPRPAGTVTHIWSYTAPETRFLEFRPIADAMLKSWTIQPENG